MVMQQVESQPGLQQDSKERLRSEVQGYRGVKEVRACPRSFLADRSSPKRASPKLSMEQMEVDHLREAEEELRIVVRAAGIHRTAKAVHTGQ
jgi:hypothetical protein